jgi:hypothetical protein
MTKRRWGSTDTGRRLACCSWSRATERSRASSWELRTQRPEGIRSGSCSPRPSCCGVGTTAQRLLAEYLFAHTTAHRLEATTGVDNLAEQHALDHAGFTQEGLLRGRGWLDGEWRDGYIYARLRTDPPPS